MFSLLNKINLSSIPESEFRTALIKSIEDDKGDAGIRLVYNGASAINEVDGISGATMTCDKVEEMINAVIEQIIKERD